MPESLERHAANWDLRHQDFNDNDFLYDVYSVMRQQSPFARTDNPFLSATPAGARVAVRYAECVKILQDWEHFSSNPTPEGAEQLAGDLVITLDPPRQQKFRKVLNPYFSPARMKALRPEIGAETDRLIDEFIEKGCGDLAQIAWRQPGIVFFKYLLGMPIEDVPLCIELTDTALNGATEQDRMSAWGGLYQHLHDAVTARMDQPPRHDMIDVLLCAEIDGEKLSFGDIVSNAMLLVQAGLETTASAMSFAYHYLATNPAERDRLIGDPELLTRAVEEFIRFAGSIHGIPRTVAKEVELSGCTFSPGESVIVNYAAANRDEQAFPDAGRCILDRRENRHLGFGAGVHRCLGSSLARLEFQVGLERVLARMPDFTLAGDDIARFHGNSVTRGFRSVPVTFAPGDRAIT
ncbi:cytochrome [Mycolicibacterium conceptionense]|uniref:Cytochrome n=2 Tax=Mycolicibacterium TaxID=1866885 RepID=A0A1A1XN68_9MYCO|nr:MULTISPECIES: cytochrome P450 [Mycolicibacterium]MCW1821847.1 cytochrome P450 [Mycolicibacterium senegalense]OBB06135.1 cytochrome [Mycolicibacterium conceptionense]OBF02268.1 cytochrome [Mycolicibacterium conceptionense]OBF20286.1 cytochrome [Mycolicibacterium conceptionense]OBF48010.1 cytochrome [Mycolicibacterium conceptionense]